jgi:hypothetical protein
VQELLCVYVDEDRFEDGIEEGNCEVKRSRCGRAELTIDI